MLGALLLRNPAAVDKQAEAAAVLSGRVIEVFDGIQVIRILRAGRPRSCPRYRDAVAEYIGRLEVWMRPLTRVQASITVLLQPIAFLLALLVAGALFLSAGWMTPLQLLPFLLLALTMGTPVIRLGNGVTSFQDAASAALRLRETESLAEVVEPVKPRTVPTDALEVVFSHVTFSYQPERPVTFRRFVPAPAGHRHRPRRALGRGKIDAGEAVASVPRSSTAGPSRSATSPSWR